MAASNYPVSFYFQLSFKGEDAAFQEVSGITKEQSIEEVVCGGENRFKYRLPTLSSSQNLVLKRALVLKNSKLASWCKHTLEDGLAFKINTQDVTVSLMKSEEEPLASWTFHKAYPIKYSVSDFRSDENKLVIETMELAYTYFEIPKTK
ncbi:phage tail protein [uncultured Winogradskyella sp.]|uniref:phage tail protein n=1 Tax=uncultured Winogradskyella sp. TaxID=395353 RepID=UPI0026251370|nr:phage tail protein [uncultured Winogradskyella sp.]